MEKTKILVFSLCALFSSSAAIATEFVCTSRSGRDTFVIALCDYQYTQIDSRTPAVDENLEGWPCVPRKPSKTKKGTLLSECLEGAVLIYRVPSSASARSEQFTVEFAWSEDSNGEHCQRSTYSCVRKR
jgi:hypothetical protein